MNVSYKVEVRYLHNRVGRWVFKFWTHVDVVVWTFDVYTIGGMGSQILGACGCGGKGVSL